MYRVELSRRAEKELKIYERSSPRDLKKFYEIYEELEQHPKKGIGHPEPLANMENGWSRHINKKDRVVYTVDDDEVYVYVISAKEHYNDK